MPRPVYMICCESMLVDGVTGLPSYINVFDTIQLAPAEVLAQAGKPPQPAAGFRMRASAVWLLEEGENPAQRYEHEFRVVIPGRMSGAASSPKLVVLFEKPYFRFDAAIQGPPSEETGICLIESRLRPDGAGDDAWRTQNYPVRIEVTHERRPDNQ